VIVAARIVGIPPNDDDSDAMHPTLVAGPSREAHGTGSRLRERDQIHKVPSGTSRPAMSGLACPVYPHPFA
jgi:hypothetical protein